MRSRKIFYLMSSALLIVFSGFAIFYFLKLMQYNEKLTYSKDVMSPTIHLVLISQEFDNPYWRQVQKGAQGAAQQYGIELEYLGPAQADIKAQIKMIEMAIASKVDGILTQGLDDEQFDPIINKAMNMGIPVITIDSDAPNSQRIAYVGTDNYAAGYMAGKELIKQSQGKANVAIITGSFQATNQIERVEGFKDAIKIYSDIRILDIKESNISRVQSMASAYEIIQHYPNVDTIIGTSALDGLGIVQMVKEFANDLNNTKTRIIAFDDLPETLSYIDQGFIEASIVQQPLIMGRKGVDLMMNYLQGETIETAYNTDVKVVRKSDLTGSGEVND